MNWRPERLWWRPTRLALAGMMGLSLLLAGHVRAQQVDLMTVVHYGEACVKLKAAILTDAGEALGKDEHVIDWISECNGNIAACQDAKLAIQRVKNASPLDCLGRVQSREAASAAYALYQDQILDLPRCIVQRC